MTKATCPICNTYTCGGTPPSCGWLKRDCASDQDAADARDAALQPSHAELLRRVAELTDWADRLGAQLWTRLNESGKFAPGHAQRVVDNYRAFRERLHGSSVFGAPLAATDCKPEGTDAGPRTAGDQRPETIDDRYRQTTEPT